MHNGVTEVSGYLNTSVAWSTHRKWKYKVKNIDIYQHTEELIFKSNKDWLEPKHTIHLNYCQTATA